MPQVCASEGLKRESIRAGRQTLESANGRPAPMSGGLLFAALQPDQDEEGDGGSGR
jgi:hypothetical protein